MRSLATCPAFRASEGSIQRAAGFACVAHALQTRDDTKVVVMEVTNTRRFMPILSRAAAAAAALASQTTGLLHAARDD